MVVYSCNNTRSAKGSFKDKSYHLIYSAAKISITWHEMA